MRKSPNTPQAAAPHPLHTSDEPTGIRLTDDAMAGIVWKGDVVIPAKDQEYQDGDLCIIRMKDGRIALRHIFRTGEDLTLLANTDAPLTVRAADVEYIHRIVCANVAGEHLRHHGPGGPEARAAEVKVPGSEHQTESARPVEDPIFDAQASIGTAMSFIRLALNPLSRVHLHDQRKLFGGMADEVYDAVTVIAEAMDNLNNANECLDRFNREQVQRSE